MKLWRGAPVAPLKVKNARSFSSTLPEKQANSTIFSQEILDFFPVLVVAAEHEGVAEALLKEGR